MAATLGINWLNDDGLNPFDLAEGRAPQADDEVVIDKGTASGDGDSAAHASATPALVKSE